MTLPAVRRLSDLVALDRSLLYVFVVGPGRGEGIAIALPTSGWLTVDGATSAVGRPPILEILDTWKAKDDRILWSFLSHPHDDHVDGFADVINTYPPDRIALAGSEGAPRYLDVLKDAPMPNVPDEALKAAKVRTTFSAIRAWETATKQTSFAVNGSTPELKHQGVTIHVRSPSAPAIAAYLTECVKRPSYIKSDANRYSIVLEIVFGASRIVLPGDLPRTVRKKAVSPGWNDLAASAPQLGEHVLLKVPHHGSAEAIHPDIMTAGASDRAWAITPYSSANRLPNVAASDGLPDIVSRGRRVLVTGLPTSKMVQGTDDDGVVSIDQLRSRVENQPLNAPFRDNRDVEVTPGSACEPLDCVWCFAVDGEGAIVGLYRGRAALDVRSAVPATVGSSA